MPGKNSTPNKTTVADIGGATPSSSGAQRRTSPRKSGGISQISIEDKNHNISFDVSSPQTKHSDSPCSLNTPKITSNKVSHLSNGANANSNHNSKKLNFHLTYLMRESHGKHMFGLCSNWWNCSQAYTVKEPLDVVRDDSIYVATMGGPTVSIYLLGPKPSSPSSEISVVTPSVNENSSSSPQHSSPSNVPPMLLMQAFVDPHPEEDFFCCAWSRGPVFSETLSKPDPVTKCEQVLAVAGKRAVIRILVPGLAKCMHTLVGHGQSINQLAFHPRDPALLFSFSKDYNIRLWNIATNVLVAIFGGAQGHRAEILHGSVHLSGRYLLSAGMDHAIKIWRIDEQDLLTAAHNSHSYSLRDSQQPFPTVLQHFPELSTRKAHGNYVDCCLWYGNLVLSKSCEEQVVIWKPGGAYGDDGEGAMSPGRNCNGKKTSVEEKTAAASSQEELIHFRLGHHEITVLHELEAAKCDIWYIRMDIDPVNHVLALGNSCGKIYLWDLETEDIFQVSPHVLSLNRAGVTGAVRQVHFTNQGRTLLCVCDNGFVARFDRE